MTKTYEDGKAEGEREGFMKAMRAVYQACSECIDETKPNDKPLAFSHRLIAKLTLLQADVVQERDTSHEVTK